MVAFQGEDPCCGSQASSAAMANQGWSLNGNSLGINMQSSWSGSVEGPFAGPFNDNPNASTAQATTDLSLTIELTSAYAVQLSVGWAIQRNTLPTSFLTGSQSASFDGAFFENDLSCSGTFLWQLLLAPGIYTMSADNSWSDEAISGFGNIHEFSDSAGVLFTADFTPVVPEPKWVVLPALLLAIASLTVGKRKSA